MVRKKTSGGTAQRAAPSFIWPGLVMALVVVAWIVVRGGLPFGLGDLPIGAGSSGEPSGHARPAGGAPGDAAGLNSGPGSGPGSAPGDAARKTPKLTLVTASGRHDISLEIADSDEKRMVGLMFRTSLPFGHGMLFPYPNDHEITMWMKNTYISLDMLFIDADGIVADIAERTTPLSLETIVSRVPVRAVLEVNAGTVAAFGIRAGDRVHHPIFARP